MCLLVCLFVCLFVCLCCKWAFIVFFCFSRLLLGILTMETKSGRMKLAQYSHLYERMSTNTHLSNINNRSHVTYMYDCTSFCLDILKR